MFNYTLVCKYYTNYALQRNILSKNKTTMEFGDSNYVLQMCTTVLKGVKMI